MNRLIALFASAVALGAILFWVSLRDLNSWSLDSKDLDSDIIVHFPRGTKLTELGVVLEREGLVSSALRFNIWVRLRGDYARFQAGNYKFIKGKIAPTTIIETMIKGEAYVPLVLQITIPEGFNTRQIAARLEGLGLGTKAEILKLMISERLLDELKVEAPSIEGYLYPATYNYTAMPNARTVLSDMVQTFWNRLPPNYLEDLRTVGLSLHQAVTFASLIELETLQEDEKAKVSEVIWRRLKARDLIAIDASLIYGIKNYKGDITWQHLRDATNKYNTRIHRGLPPGPIGSPSASSLTAVLKPTTAGYYFYVLIPDGKERHHFSKSLSEHNRYVKLLLETTSKTAAAKP